MNSVDGEWGPWEESPENCPFCLTRIRTCKEPDGVEVNPCDRVQCEVSVLEDVNIASCHEQEAWNQLGGGYTLQWNYIFHNNTFQITNSFTFIIILVTWDFSSGDIEPTGRQVHMR